MLLATRCPHCETVFRLQQDQLTLHDGLVRCGHCRQVFDATRSLVPEPTVREAAVERLRLERVRLKRLRVSNTDRSNAG
jgi:predicted Zn finger-like uncharacterized protein